MRYGLVILVLLAFFLETDAARRVKLVPIEDGQHIFWSGGTPIIALDVVSGDGVTRVFVTPAAVDYDKNQRISFYVSVYNHTPDTIDVDPSKSTVRNNKGKDLRIVGPNQIRKEIRDDAKRAAFVQALASAMQGYASGYSNSLAGSTPYQNMQQQAAIQRQAQYRKNELNRQTQDSLSLTTLYFGRTTILPGEHYIGFLDVYPPNKKSKADTVTLNIHAGANIHTIRFLYTPID